MKRNYLLLFFAFNVCQSFSQDRDVAIIKNIFSEALINSPAYVWLDTLSNQIGGRLSGSPEAAEAVRFVKKELVKLKPDNVMLQEVKVPYWVRGKKEQAYIKANRSSQIMPLSICALGGSIATPDDGVAAKVVEIRTFEELDSIGKKKLLEGKIVFVNHPMNPANYNTFQSYGEAVRYRWASASRAGAYGAKAVIVRSMTLAMDDFPHTGSMGYVDTIPKIPACAVSTNGAETLKNELKRNPDLVLYIKLNCQMLPDADSHNVIAEIKGSDYPEEIIAFGGHLDAWELGDGAHDDGAGVVQVMEIMRLFKSLNIKPKRTIRCVAFMNEENGGKGGEKFASAAKVKGEKIIAAIESDAGGFTPRGFSFKGDSMQIQRAMEWKKYFEPFGVHEFFRGYGGADINHLEDQGTLLIGLSVDSQRYFDYHHAANDTFDKVNKRELELGAATMASLVYLLSEYGVK